MGCVSEGSWSLSFISFKVNPSLLGSIIRLNLRRVEMCVFCFVLFCFQNLSRWVSRQSLDPSPLLRIAVQNFLISFCLSAYHPLSLPSPRSPWQALGETPRTQGSMKGRLLPWGAHGPLENWSQSEHRINCPKAVGATQPGHEDRPGGPAEGLTFSRVLLNYWGFSKERWQAVQKNTVLWELTNQMHVWQRGGHIVGVGSGLWAVDLEKGQDLRNLGSFGMEWWAWKFLEQGSSTVRSVFCTCVQYSQPPTIISLFYDLSHY